MKVRDLARSILKEVRVGRRWVWKKEVTSFLCVWVSLTLPMPWARFYTRAIYWEINSARRMDGRGRYLLIHKRIRDLLKWKKLTRQELYERTMVPPGPKAALHEDAAELGWGGTLDDQELSGSVDGICRAQGIRDWRELAESIRYRELNSISMLLTGTIGTEV